MALIPLCKQLPKLSLYAALSSAENRCLTILQEDGITGFWRGITAHLLKAPAVFAVVYFIVLCIKSADPPTWKEIEDGVAPNLVELSNRWKAATTKKKA